VRRAALALTLLAAACGGGDEEALREARMVYTRGDAQRSDLYVARTDGSDERRLTHGPGFKYDADWSPDGSRIAYRFEPDTGSEASFIVVMNADGTGAYSVSERSGVKGSAPSWSPDGNRIAFAGARGEEDLPLGIYLVDADGSRPMRLTPKRFEAQYPAWSPDGKRIAFTAVEAGGFDVFVINADGTGLRRLTDTPEAENWPMWSPDGKRLAIHSEGDGVSIMNAGGSGRTTLDLGEHDCGVPGNWAPSDWLVLNCALQGERIGIGAIRPDGSGFTLLLDGRDAGFPALRPGS
jgi:TolB protein